LRKRKTYDDNFKARIALEGIKAKRKISEIAGQFEVHPNQIFKCEKQLLENVSSLFSKKKDPEIEELRKLVERENEELSIRRQCELISLNRSSLYYELIRLSEKEQRILEEMDKIYLDFPTYRIRRINRELKRQGFKVGRTKARSLMQILGVMSMVIEF